MGLLKSASLKPTARNMARFGERCTPSVMRRLRRVFIESLLDSPEVLIRIVVQEGAARITALMNRRNVEDHRIGKRLGEMLIARNQAQHFIRSKSNHPVGEVESQCSFQHHHHAFRFMTVILRKSSL